MIPIVLLILSNIIPPAVPARVSSTPDTTEVSIRVLDYAWLDAQALRAAEEQVAETYRRIGVRTAWLPAIRQNDMPAYAARVDDAAGRVLTVVFVRDRMMSHGAVPRTVAGYAGTAGQGGARTAFVLADRTARIAWRAGVSHSRVLGVVMAHELAHLLLPNRPHARVGLTRGNWVPAEFRDSRHWRFSADEAACIRESIAGLTQGPAQISD